MLLGARPPRSGAGGGDAAPDRRGVDTGPVYGYYSTSFDERRESHVVIQLRSVYDNFDRISEDLAVCTSGSAVPIDVSGRKSAAWGQPRLSDYLRWKWAARGTA